MSPDEVVVKFRDNIYITPGIEQSGFPGGKESACQCEIQIWSLDWEDTLEKEMATHSIILAWETPWTERNLVGYSPWGRKESETT